MTLNRLGGTWSLPPQILRFAQRAEPNLWFPTLRRRWHTRLVTHSAGDNNYFLTQLVVSFSKNPHPPRHRRPCRIQHENGFNRDKRFDLRSSLSKSSRWLFGMHPFGNRGPRFLPKIISYGCHQPGHFLRNCLDLDLRMAQLQLYVDLGDSAAYIMGHANKKVEDEGHKVITYFSFTEQQFTESTDYLNNHDVAMDAWQTSLFAVVENDESAMQASSSDFGSSSKRSHYSSYGFVLLLLSELREIMKTIISYFSPSSNTHILLNTRAPRSISSEELLKNENWAPLKKSGLLASEPPLRFAGNSVSAL